MDTTGTVPRDGVDVRFTTGEAMYVLDAVIAAGAKAYAIARRLEETNAPAEEREVARTAADLLDRAHRKLDGQLYPLCRYLDDDDCDRPVAGTDERGVPYCAIHLEHVHRVHAIVGGIA